MSYPILYKANETNFDHLGLSVLSDATKCLVTRERNGLYFLEMDYPIDGKDYKKIDLGCILKCDAGHRAKQQRFIVSKITETKEGYSKIYAKHISWERISKNALQARVSASGNAFVALEQWRSHLIDSPSDFAVWSDVTTQGEANWKVENFDNAYQVLGGKQGSILDVWGGEYEFDNLTIKLWEQMGQESSTIIAYGRNLIDLEQEKAILDTYTSVYPFAIVREGEQETLLTLPEKIVDSKYVSHYPERKILKLDLSNNESVKTVEHLRQAATNYIKANKVGVPKVHLSLSYQDLARVSSVWGNPVLDIVDLCDRVKVYFEKINIKSTNAKITKVIWDVLLDENSSIEIGDSRTSFSEAVGVKESTEDALKKAIGYVSEGFNAKLTERIRVVNRQIDAEIKKIEDSVKTGIEVAKAKSEQFKSELEAKINAEIKPLANGAKQDADRANQSIARQAQNIERVRIRLIESKREIIDQVNGTIAKTFDRVETLRSQTQRTLSDEIAAVSQTLSETKRTVLEQANAQTELSSRVTTVEETANGTKTTVTELQKTVNAATGNLDAVSRRTKTVEDNLSGLTTRFENMQIGGANLLRLSDSVRGYYKSATGSDAQHSEYSYAQPIKIEPQQPYVLQAWTESRNTSSWIGYIFLDANQSAVPGSYRSYYPGQIGYGKWDIVPPENAKYIQISFSNDVFGDNPNLKIQLEKGSIATDYHRADDDIRSELATYKQTVDRNFAELTRTTQTVSDRFTEYKSAFDQTAERFRTSLNALEAFKNDEGARESRYLSLSREETARQLQTVRSDITRDYVSKSQLTETTRGIEQRFERIKVGSSNLLALSKSTTGAYRNTGGRLVADSKYSYSALIPIEPDTDYMLQAWVNRSNPDSWLGVVAFDQQENFVTGTYRSFYLRDTKHVSRTLNYTSNVKYIQFSYSNDVFGDNPNLKIQFEKGNVPTDYRPSDLDRQSELATYKNTVDSQLSELSSTINANNSAFTTFKNSYERTAQGVTEKLTALEAYKNNEHLRSNAYLEASKTETAKQLQTLRTVISEDYVAKSIYEENAESITRRFEKLNEALSDKVSSSTFKQKADEILGRVQTLDGEVMKTSNFTINENGIVLQSGRTFDGRTIASLLTVNDDNIKAITDRMIITPNNENLIHPNFRSGITINKRETVFPNTHTIDLKNDDEFLIKWKGVRNTSQHFGILLYITYEDSTKDWKFCNFKEKSVSGRNDIETTFKVTGLRKKVRSWQIGCYISVSSNLGSFTVESFEMYQKKSASLIVDGSITGRHVKANSLETGHHKAGSVTTTVLAANAVTAEKLLVNQALIDKLVTDDLLARAITTSMLFATAVQAVDISATRVTSGILASRNGAISWDLDKNNLILNQTAKIQFNSFYNQLVIENKGNFNGSPTSGGIAVTKTKNTENVSVVFGTSSGRTFDINDVSFTGLRIHQTNYHCGLYGSTIDISDTFDSDGHTAWTNAIYVSKDRESITLSSRNFTGLDVNSRCTLKITPDGITVHKNGQSRTLI